MAELLSSTGDGEKAASPLHAETITEIPASPRQFYETFIRRRKPVVLKSQASAVLNNPDVLKLDIPKLLDIVRQNDQQSNLVEVNQISSNSFSPTAGSTVSKMPFPEFCQELQKSDETICAEYYMTTQTFGTCDEGRPDVFNWLTKLLLESNVIPLRPDLLGNLIPMSVGNLWMGRSSSTGLSSSGLHHDFHDNLYCLVAGCKTIRIAPPDCVVHQFEMTGTLHKLYSNGRIVYKEQIGGGPIRPDGALESVERIVQLEIQKEEIEQKLKENNCGESDKQSLEEELDRIEEELLDIEMENDGDVNDDDGSTDSKEEPSLFCGDPASSQQQQDGGDTVIDSAQVQADTGENEKNGDTSSGFKDKESSTPSCSKKPRIDSTPPNFVVREKRQDGQPPVEFQTLVLQAGDVLYLPAGWFHQVSSGGGIHMAFNYWTHPPDSDSDFDKPYRSHFWQRDWDARGLKF